MQFNRLLITVNRPPDQVFDFTIDPVNTPRWIEHIHVEECSEFPPKLATVYRNKGIEAELWSEYSVNRLELNKIFELVAADGNYHVRYSYNQEGTGTIMEYLEWVDRGNLESPFTQDILDKLKGVLETTNCQTV